jgi:hypothetical protein
MPEVDNEPFMPGFLRADEQQANKKPLFEVRFMTPRQVIHPSI